MPDALSRSFSLPSWRSLIGFSRSKFVGSSLFWVALVPTVARVTRDFSNVVSIRIGETVHQFYLGVPFSWGIFFFGALYFLLATVIVNWKAPRIIKETATFRDFIDQGRSPAELHVLLGRSQRSQGNTALPTEFLSNSEKLKEDLAESLERIMKVPNDGVVSEKEQSHALTLAYEIAVNQTWNFAMPGWRAQATTFYLVGSCCYLFVLLQSAIYVVQQMDRGIGVLR